MPGIVFKGRADMMAKSAGKWVDMTEVEDAVGRVPGVLAVKIIAETCLKSRLRSCDAWPGGKLEARAGLRPCFDSSDADDKKGGPMDAARGERAHAPSKTQAMLMDAQAAQLLSIKCVLVLHGFGCRDVLSAQRVASLRKRKASNFGQVGRPRIAPLSSSTCLLPWRRMVSPTRWTPCGAASRPRCRHLGRRITDSALVPLFA